MPSIPLRYKLRSKVGALFRRKLMRARAQFLETARYSCRESQQQTLQRLLKLNADSQFSKDYHLDPGLTVEEFRTRIPVSDYSLVKPYIERMKTGEHSALLGADNRLLMYAVTSGTTAQSKLIPVTSHFVDDYRRSWQTWGAGCHLDHTTLQMLFMVQVASSHQRYTTQDGTPCGNISGLVAAMQNFMVRALYTVPLAVAHLEDPLAKRHAVVRFAIEDPWVGMLVTANPSTLLQMVEYAEDNAESLIRDIYDGTASRVTQPGDHSLLKTYLKPNRRRAQALEDIVEEHGTLKLSACWPHLACLGVWSGGSAASYIPQLRQTFGNIAIRDHGLHASEGRMTLPIADNTSSGLLEIATHFFEFIPVEESDSTDPVIMEAHELQEGQEYLILLTTSSGLYRYNIRDVVRCTGFYGSTPLLEFRHKGAHISSITGEKLAESQVVEAVGRTCEQHELDLHHFTLTPRWGTPPGYTLFICPVKKLHEDAVRSLAKTTETLLTESNCEYQEKRETGRLDPIEVRVLPLESWNRFTEYRLAVAGGSPEQYKHPCLMPDPQFQQTFLRQCGIHS
ncbi:MAG: GH3 auxin-responsive promoter family protein [Fuerstiella sp.]|nr:GH3 auxin-responsive promoter family protein [Fuerstiella sp.]